MTEPPAPPSTAGRSNPAALALIGVGAVLGALSLSVLPWFRGTVGLVRGAHSRVGDIGDLLDNLVTARRALGDKHAFRLGLSEYYYSWLAWLLLAAAVVVAVVACLPTHENKQVRLLGTGLALLGVVATLWAVDVYRADVDGRGTVGAPRPSVDYLPDDGPGFGAFWRHTSYGAWAALAAFVLIAVGALLGPRHRAAVTAASPRPRRPRRR